MKKVYLLISSLFISSAVLAQEVKNVGIGTIAPDRSAVLDIQSNDKGLLIPRLTEVQMNSIADPAKGLLVFKADASNSGFFFFNGEKWSPLTNGDANAIATVDANGWALDGNLVSNSSKAAATASSFIGTPGSVPINFKIGNFVAGQIDQSARNNTLYGYKAGNTLVSGTGNNNTAYGYESMASLNGGNHNTAMGRLAMRSLTSGVGNIAIGATALQNSTTASYNFAIGFGALLNNTVGNYNTAIGTSALEQVTGSGKNNNTAIGAQAGRYKNGVGNVYIGYGAGHNISSTTVDEDNKLYISNIVTNTPLLYGDFSARFISIGNVPVDKREAVASGGQYSLIVEKGILSEKLKVALKTTTDWADYVFEQDYKDNMMSLEEVEAFTLKNKHLPNVPSAKDLVEKGLDFNETSRMFMEKIEELTLYMIELNKEVKVLKAENQGLKSKVQEK